MAKAPEAKEPSDGGGEALAVVASDLDEKTHAERVKRQDRRVPPDRVTLTDP